MEEKHLQEFKAKLEAKKADIVKELSRIGSRAAGGEINFNANYPDYGDSASIEDSASEVADYTTNLSLERELEGDLRDVEKALKSIAAGTYGKCKYCSKEIEIERLRIRPESNSCVSCKNTLKGSA